jgi:hypothetical protein
MVNLKIEKLERPEKIVRECKHNSWCKAYQPYDYENDDLRCFETLNCDSYFPVEVDFNTEIFKMLKQVKPFLDYLKSIIQELLNFDVDYSLTHNKHLKDLQLVIKHKSVKITYIIEKE